MINRIIIIDYAIDHRHHDFRQSSSCRQYLGDIHHHHHHHHHHYLWFRQASLHWQGWLASNPSPQRPEMTNMRILKNFFLRVRYVQRTKMTNMKILKNFFYEWDICNVLRWKIWGFWRHFYEREKRNGDDKIMLISMRMMMVVVIVMIMMVMMIIITLNRLYLSKKLPSQLSSVCEATLPRRRNRKKSICLARDTIWKKRKRYKLEMTLLTIKERKQLILNFVLVHTP